MFTVKENVYVDESGKVSHEAGKGRTLNLVRGAVISDEQAGSLGLRKLGRELDKAAVAEAKRQNDVLAPVQKDEPENVKAGTQKPTTQTASTPNGTGTTAPTATV